MSNFERFTGNSSLNIVHTTVHNIGLSIIQCPFTIYFGQTRDKPQPMRLIFYKTLVFPPWIREEQIWILRIASHQDQLAVEKSRYWVLPKKQKRQKQKPVPKKQKFCGRNRFLKGRRRIRQKLLFKKKKFIPSFCFLGSTKILSFSYGFPM